MGATLGATGPILPSDSPAEKVEGVLLHVRHDMGIRVHCDTNRGVTEEFLNHFRLNAEFEKQTRATVSEIVEANVRESSIHQ